MNANALCYKDSECEQKEKTHETWWKKATFWNGGKIFRERK